MCLFFFEGGGGGVGGLGGSGHRISGSLGFEALRLQLRAHGSGLTGLGIHQKSQEPRDTVCSTGCNPRGLSTQELGSWVLGSCNYSTGFWVSI